MKDVVLESSSIETHSGRLAWRDYLELCKPRVVTMLVITAIVGMHLAVPGWVPLDVLVFGTLGIACAASSAAAVNHVVDRRIDRLMGRTRGRPLPQGAVSTRSAIAFAAVLGMLSMALLLLFINPLTAVLTLAGLVGYAFVYTMFLKHATPQNIVIGGLSGALPPLLGWTAVTGSVGAEALLLVMIIFVWTPAHFWPLAIDRIDEYRDAQVPMLPVTHGIEYTKSCVIFYTLAVLLVSLLPYTIGMSGPLYLAVAVGLGVWFLWHAVALKFKPSKTSPRKTFYVSIHYLLYLFIALLLDHYLPF